jgi:hypothetical protein
MMVSLSGQGKEEGSSSNDSGNNFHNLVYLFVDSVAFFEGSTPKHRFLKFLQKNAV